MRTDCAQERVGKIGGAQPTQVGRILIVECEDGPRRIYRTQLEEAGYAVEAVAGGEEALAHIAAPPSPDVLIVAIRLEGMSGLTVMRRALALDPQLSVIVHSAYPTYRGDFSSWCAEAYVVKSTDQTVLVGAVKRVMEKRRAGGKIAS